LQQYWKRNPAWFFLVSLCLVGVDFDHHGPDRERDLDSFIREIPMRPLDELVLDRTLAFEFTHHQPHIKMMLT
jgi:hypothetical protein